jgi:glycosyltransferase involved in cell wall biosynthesis
MNSICIATYNGEKFIYQQLVSIINQIEEQDEIIIIDDFSDDKTVEIIKSIDDHRIKLHINKSNLGHVKTFEKAISFSKGNFIFLSDQDDIWTFGRYKYLLNSIINCKASLLISNYNNFTSDPVPYNIIQMKLNQLHGLITIIKIFLGKGNYFGCTFIFKSSSNKYLLPFSNHVFAHDLYIVLVNLIFGKVFYTNYVSVYRRLHTNNLTRKSNLFKMINYRIKLFLQIIFLIRKL